MPVLSSLIKKLQDIEKDLEPYLMRSRLNNLEQSLTTIKEGLDEVADLIKKGQISDRISKKLTVVQSHSETQLKLLESAKGMQGDIECTNIFTPEFIEKLERESGAILKKINTDLQQAFDNRTYAKEQSILHALGALWEKICQAVKSLMPHRDTKTRESEQGLAMSHTPAVVFSEDLKNTSEMQDLVEQREDELIKKEQQNTARKASAAQRRGFQ